MATLKQRKVAEAVIENAASKETKTAGEILENAGYSEAIIKNPQMVMRSKGVKEELYRLGFDEEAAKQVVGEILQFGDEDKDRLKAAEIIFKVFGSFAPDKSINLNVEVEASEEVKEATHILNEYYRKHGRLPSDGGSSSAVGEEVSDQN